MYIIAFKSEGWNMRRFKYESKHVTVSLDVYSPRETVAIWKQDIKKFKKWLHTPKDKRKKLIEFKIEREK